MFLPVSLLLLAAFFLYFMNYRQLCSWHSLTHNKYVPLCVLWFGQNKRVMPQLHKMFEVSSGGRGRGLAMPLVSSAVTHWPQASTQSTRRSSSSLSDGASHLTMLSLVSNVGPGSTLLSPTSNLFLSAFLSADECVTFVFFHMEFCLSDLSFNPGWGGGQTPFLPHTFCLLPCPVAGFLC